ncbi:MAG: hypothetical protein HRU12_15200 [Phaeodactylibacter sp.]|nr:hypothetical protein [Phaeodactylibacter sp.]
MALAFQPSGPLVLAADCKVLAAIRGNRRWNAQAPIWIEEGFDILYRQDSGQTGNKQTGMEGIPYPFVVTEIQGNQCMFGANEI